MCWSFEPVLDRTYAVQFVSFHIFWFWGVGKAVRETLLLQTLFWRLRKIWVVFWDIPFYYSWTEMSWLFCMFMIENCCHLILLLLLNIVPVMALDFGGAFVLGSSLKSADQYVRPTNLAFSFKGTKRSSTQRRPLSVQASYRYFSFSYCWYTSVYVNYGCCLLFFSPLSLTNISKNFITLCLH